MELSERVKFLRKDYLKLTQEEFASRIKVSRSNLASIEIGRINLTDRVIQDICDEFNINQDWLRTGSGEIFEEVLEEDEYMRAAAEISRDNDVMAMNMLIEYWKLDRNSKEVFKNYLLKLADKIKE